MKIKSNVKAGKGGGGTGGRGGSRTTTSVVPAFGHKADRNRLG